jgi:hypothetical protein
MARARRRTTTDRLVRLSVARSFGVLLLTARSAFAQMPTFPASDVRVAVTVRSDGVATVRQEYQLSSAVAGSWFEYLSVPCAVVGPVAIRAGGLPFDHEVSARGPWVQLGDSARPFTTRDGLVLVTYDVRLTSREVGIPIVFPRAPLANEGEYGVGRLALAVNFASGVDNTVLLPRLEQSDSGTTWTGRLLAFPSMVRVRLTRSASSFSATCTDPLVEETSGRLSKLLLVFGGTMAVWVPLYFLWVSLTGRRSRGDGSAR